MAAVKRSRANLRLKGLDDIFSSAAAEENADIKEIALNQIRSFKDHPFRVTEDEDMEALAESIRENGVLVPVVVRPLIEGGFEMISGHRRLYASRMAGKTTIPAIVKTMTDEEAVIAMVDSNIQREGLLPSEKAFSYKMKMEAVRHQGKSLGTDTSCQNGTKRSDAMIAEGTGDSARKIQRYIRLTYLIPELLQMVDDQKLLFGAGVSVSYLSADDQETVLEIVKETRKTVSGDQAEKLKALSDSGSFSEEAAREILAAPKKEEKNNFLKGKARALKKYFPKTYTTGQMEEVILGLLEAWAKEHAEARESDNG